MATYDLQPEMSAPGVTDALVEAIGSGRYDFIVANYANPDMVGHTGVWEADGAGDRDDRRLPARVVAATDAVDREAPGAPGAVLAGHRRSRQRRRMRDGAGAPVTAHSLNPVPIVAVGRAVAGRHLHDGVLADVTPTILELAGLPTWPGVVGTVASGPCATIRPPFKPEVRSSVNPLFAVGQMIVGIALMISILLQARGTGLSGAFGGDSAVYRSRRGVERRLWQFTIVLMVLFVLFSLASYALFTSTPAA